jgi:peroxiredoxin
MHKPALSKLGTKRGARRTGLPVLAAIVSLTAFSLCAYAAKVGDPAPDFTGTDTNGQTHKLSEYRGKYVVLEWTNNGCPYTRKHYTSGNMQNLQKEWTAKGVVWLTVLSSAKGEQGYMTASDENAYMSKVHASPSAALLDPTGAIGHQYDARTTPDMYVIDPAGKLIYAELRLRRAHPSHGRPADRRLLHPPLRLQCEISGRRLSSRFTTPYHQGRCARSGLRLSAPQFPSSCSSDSVRRLLHHARA